MRLPENYARYLQHLSPTLLACTQAAYDLWRARTANYPDLDLIDDLTLTYERACRAYEKERKNDGIKSSSK